MDKRERMEEREDRPFSNDQQHAERPSKRPADERREVPGLGAIVIVCSSAFSKPTNTNTHRHRRTPNQQAAVVEDKIEKLNAMMERLNADMRELNVKMDEKEAKMEKFDPSDPRYVELQKDKEALRQDKEVLRHRLAGLEKEKEVYMEGLRERRHPKVAPEQSPEKPTEPAIDMREESLIIYFRALMADPNKVNINMHMLHESDLHFPLSGRDEALKVVKGVMDGTILGGQEGQSNRRKYPIMVCCGLSGLGKSRMLEEWERYWEMVPQPGVKVAVLVLYKNGHGVRTMDTTIGWPASIAWRFLHRFFLEGNTKNSHDFARWFRFHLPSNAAALDMRLALQTVKMALVQARQMAADQVLSIFVGVDEFQVIKDLADESKPSLESLLACKQLPGFQVTMMLAGLHWGPFSISRSSNVDMKRLPMGFLKPREVEACVEPVVDGLLAHRLFRHHIFALGGVPAMITTYVDGLKRLRLPLSDTDFKSAYQQVMTNIYNRTWAFPSLSDHIRLVAWALCGRTVSSKSCPNIGVVLPRGEVVRTLTWQQIADTGYCLLVEREDQYFVHVPYCVIAACRRSGDTSNLSLGELRMLDCIEWLRGRVDNVMQDLEPWQSWERFGACCHALRINSLLVIQQKDICSVRLLDLFPGCLYDAALAQLEVTLVPVMVARVAEQFGASMGALLTDVDNPHFHYNWVDGDIRGASYVVLNGTSGKGTDIFFALKSTSGGIVVVADQRRRVATKSLSERNVKDVSEKVESPGCVKDALLVTGLFHVFPVTLPTVPQGMVLMGASELENYYGCLALHPAADPRVFINTDNQSALACIRGIGDDTAKKIIQRRKHTLFSSVDDFTGWLLDECKIRVSDEELERIFVQ